MVFCVFFSFFILSLFLRFLIKSHIHARAFSMFSNLLSLPFSSEMYPHSSLGDLWRNQGIVTKISQRYPLQFRVDGTNNRYRLCKNDSNFEEQL